MTPGSNKIKKDILYLNVFDFRAIKYLFKDKLKLPTVLLVVMTIYILSAALVSPMMYFGRYLTQLEWDHHGQKPHKVSHCWYQFPTLDWHKALCFLQPLSYGYVPFIFIAILNYYMFREIKDQEIIGNSTINVLRMRRLFRVCRRFRTVIIAYSLLVFPYAVFNNIYSYLYIYEHKFFVKHVTNLAIAYEVFKMIIMCNSCINPLVYARLHVTLYSWISNLGKKGCCLKRNNTSPEPVAVIRMVPIRKRTFEENMSASDA